MIIKIDKEYSTAWWDEVKYLLDHNIRYTFVKTIDNVTVWKFKKNSLLFNTLGQFYDEVYSI